ncbi:MAG: hypothetical protein NC184_06020 [Roseburia sp.]|nr:hypothetical protein [Roseburia sp.]
MIKSLEKLFTETLKISSDVWMFVLLGIVAVAFIVSLVVGLVSGDFAKIKGNMRGVVSQPNAAVEGMKKMPVSVRTLYKNARLSGIKPSVYVTEDACVSVPYRRSLISKVWLITFIAAIVCTAIGFFVAPLALQGELARAAKDAAEVATESLEEAVEAASGSSNSVSEMGVYIVPLVISLVGGLLTLIGGIIGKIALGGAVSTYGQFARVIDAGGAAPQENAQQYSEPQPQQQRFEQQNVGAQAMYEEPHHEVEAEPVVEAEPSYAEPTGFAEEPTVVVEPQESDEEIRRRAREEAMAQARAQQAAQAQAQAQAQAHARAQQAAQAQAQARAAQQAQAQTASAGSSSVDDVVARIEQISREGASRETMREVATVLQKERAKPENKTPEQQKKLNEALSKLLKAMSASARK